MYSSDRPISTRSSQNLPSYGEDEVIARSMPQRVTRAAAPSNAEVNISNVNSDTLNPLPTNLRASLPDMVVAPLFVPKLSASLMCGVRVCHLLAVYCCPPVFLTSNQNMSSLQQPHRHTQHARLTPAIQITKDEVTPTDRRRQRVGRGAGLQKAVRMESRVLWQRQR